LARGAELLEVTLDCVVVAAAKSANGQRAARHAERVATIEDDRDVLRDAGQPLEELRELWLSNAAKLRSQRIVVGRHDELVHAIGGTVETERHAAVARVVDERSI